MPARSRAWAGRERLLKIFRRILKRFAINETCEYISPFYLPRSSIKLWNISSKQQQLWSTYTELHLLCLKIYGCIEFIKMHCFFDDATKTDVISHEAFCLCALNDYFIIKLISENVLVTTPPNTKVGKSSGQLWQEYSSFSFMTSGRSQRRNRSLKIKKN